MRFNNLEDWLSWQETLNPAEIELGLERINTVLSLSGLTPQFNCPLITVAGTNGKGSVVAILESIALSAGLNVCSYTSPHLLEYNERIKLNGEAVADDMLCDAFARIDAARGGVELTYFEFGTLAAIDIFHRQAADIIIMEVGLGGRLDAVNCMDSDVSILTSVAIDHIEWLGDNRDQIGFEKAGVFRAEKPVICGDPDPPKSVIEYAEELHCELRQINRDYGVVSLAETKDWSLQSCYRNVDDLPEPVLIGAFQKDNAATAIVALQAVQKVSGLAEKDLLSREVLAKGLQRIRLAGRFQKIHEQPSVYLDVAHNPHAAKALLSQLKADKVKRPHKTWAINAMLADKDVAEVIKTVSSEIDFWCLSGLCDVARGLSVQALVSKLTAGCCGLSGNSKYDLCISEQMQHELSKNQCTILNDSVLLASTVSKACECVLAKVSEGDRIIIFGSFYTVAQATRFFTDLKDDYMGLKH